MEQLQSHLWLTPPHIWGNICAFPHILGSPYSYVTLQLLHSEFPYIWGKFSFLFYQCTYPTPILLPPLPPPRSIPPPTPSVFSLFIICSMRLLLFIYFLVSNSLLSNSNISDTPARYLQSGNRWPHTGNHLVCHSGKFHTILMFLSVCILQSSSTW